MKPIRSFLFIPGDSEKKLAKLDTSGADAVILDLEDAVAPSNKSAARELVAEALVSRPKENRAPQIWVRINPFDTGLTLEDLAAVIPGAPNGIMQPKINGSDDVEVLSYYLDALEVQAGIERGSTKILPVATETAIAPFRLSEFASRRLGRLAGLTWGAEDLSAALGASTNLGPDGQWDFTYRMVRSLCLMAAHAAGVQAIETLYVDFRDEEGLRHSSRSARAEGFSGRIAIHPVQVAGINESFSPSPEEVAFAEKIVSAFETSPGLGSVGIDGKMYDIPHLKSARRTLELHEASHER